MKHPKAALESFNKALEIDPKNLAALFHKANLARTLNDKNTALMLYKKYLEIAYTKHIKNEYFYKVLSYVEDLEHEKKPFSNDSSIDHNNPGTP